MLVYYLVLSIGAKNYRTILISSHTCSRVDFFALNMMKWQNRRHKLKSLTSLCRILGAPSFRHFCLIFLAVWAYKLSSIQHFDMQSIPCSLHPTLGRYSCCRLVCHKLCTHISSLESKIQNHWLWKHTPPWFFVNAAMFWFLAPL